MAALLRDWKIPLLIHQPSYNLLNRWSIPADCWIRCWRRTASANAFTPLAQGLLTGKYLQQIPEGSRMFYEGKRARGLTENMLSESNLNSLRLLQGDGPQPRAEYGANGAELAAEGSSGHVGADWRQPPTAAGGERIALKNLTFSAEEAGAD